MHAKINQFDVYGSKYKSFSLEEVCKEFGLEASLIEVEKVNKIKCFNKSVSLTGFCLRKFKKDPNFIRGFYQKESKQVSCQFANQVVFSYKCDGKKAHKICNKGKYACQSIRPTLAYNLQLDYSTTIVDQLGFTKINCYFSDGKTQITAIKE